MKAKQLFVKDCIRLVLLVCLSSFFNTSVYAGVENRPINTDDAYTLDKGVFTISLGSVFTREANHDKEIDLNIDLGYGITDRLEITADIPFVFLNPEAGINEEGIGDISVRPEYMFLEERENIPAMSLAATFELQSGDKDKGLGSGATDYSLSLQVSKNFDPVSVHFNLGYTFIGKSKGEDLDNVIFYNFACEYVITGKLTLVGELIGQTNSDPGATNDPMEILAGMIYEITSNVNFDVGFGAGLNNASPDIRVTGGITFEF